MDQIDSEKGQEKPPEQSPHLTPSSRGRQRKKNSRYLDYETDDKDVVKSIEQKTPRKSSGGQRAASQRSAARNRKAKTAAQPTTDEGNESTDKRTPESVGQTVAKTPKRRARAKRSLSKNMSKKAAVTDGDHPAGEAGEGVVENAVQQENGTPKPKRKYVRKQPVQEVKDPQCEKDSGKLPTEPEEEVEPGGRRRRGAAKAALKYLHLLAKEVFSHSSEEPDCQPSAKSEDKASKQRNLKKSKGRKRKRLNSDNSDAAEDEDFVPDMEEEDADEVEDEEVEEENSDADSDIVAYGRSPSVFHVKRSNAQGSNGKAYNGLPLSAMKTHWDVAETTKKFREEHYSSWVFTEWVPSTKDWDAVPQSDLEKYLPQERCSAAFTVSREGLPAEKETPKLTLRRFEAVPAHPDRWDMFLFAGGPLWAMEWCPTPDGAPATQYVALACHRGMDDLHYVHQTCTEPGLVQLWDCGSLEYNSRPDAKPALVYGLAQDKGFIWHLKWCPAGAWELPSCVRKAPFLPRLGLLAVASSSGVVTIYSLPHPDALLSNKKLSEDDSKIPPIYKVRGVVTLKLGSIRAPRNEKSGQVLSMDWVPQKPHNIIAIGFYDGVVGLWDLSTKSALLRVRESDRSMSLLPYRCILAHDHAVLALAFCSASRHLLTTAGEDRYVKTWDLRRLCEPITVQKRNLTTEICWPLIAPGLLIAQDCAFVARGSQGVHYFDHNMRSYFPILRNTSVWSLSYSEWLNSLLSSDDLGEVIFAVLPQMNCTLPYLRRTVVRRFPLYVTSLVPCDATEEENEEMGGVEEKERETDAASEGGMVGKDSCSHRQLQTYKEAVKKYYLHYTDSNMRTLAGLERRAFWKRMKNTEGKANTDVDGMSLAALYKVRFNPNMSSHVWVVSGGQTGLLRLHCLRTLISPNIKKMIGESQAQFNALFPAKDQSEEMTEQL
ncbi:general transcription factor 3C polypeptide 2 isoform 1-T2 [Odontesthes bonariensis]|uniref:general transcription factor 3C polypeptide 2 n=1 Tax=Odontesthes bonariensis TaxID=219752 RepID=UPI003F588841